MPGVHLAHSTVRRAPGRRPSQPGSCRGCIHLLISLISLPLRKCDECVSISDCVVAAEQRIPWCSLYYQLYHVLHGECSNGNRVSTCVFHHQPRNMHPRTARLTVGGSPITHGFATFAAFSGCSSGGDRRMMRAAVYMSSSAQLLPVCPRFVL